MRRFRCLPNDLDSLARSAVCASNNLVRKGFKALPRAPPGRVPIGDLRNVQPRSRNALEIPERKCRCYGKEQSGLAYSANSASRIGPSGTAFRYGDVRYQGSSDRDPTISKEAVWFCAKKEWSYVVPVDSSEGIW